MLNVLKALIDGVLNVLNDNVTEAILNVLESIMNVLEDILFISNVFFVF